MHSSKPFIDFHLTIISPRNIIQNLTALSSSMKSTEKLYKTEKRKSKNVWIAKPQTIYIRPFGMVSSFKYHIYLTISHIYTQSKKKIIDFQVSTYYLRVILYERTTYWETHPDGDEVIPFHMLCSRECLQKKKYVIISMEYGVRMVEIFQAQPKLYGIVKSE